jgi:hypothetical protein
MQLVLGWPSVHCEATGGYGLDAFSAEGESGLKIMAKAAKN